MTPTKPSPLRGIGPKTQNWLDRIGIQTREALLALGPQQAYEDLIDIGHPPNRNLLYGLIGAAEDRDWREVAAEYKARQADTERTADAGPSE